MSESQANNENQSNVGVGTRSGLVWEIIRILQECGDNKPQVLICENVPQLHSKDNASDFHKLQVELNNMGYINFWEDMNAVDYTQIPQNRNRTFMVSIYDPTKQATYSFPLKTKLKTRLKDFLEKNVDEKYYLSEKMVEYISATGTENFANNDSKINLDVARPLTTEQNKRAGTTNYLSDDLPENADLKQFNNKALNETIANNDVKDGDFIDAYNRDVKSDVAGTITTRVSESNNTFVVEETLKKELCNELIKEGKVQEGDIVKHSYTAQIMKGNKKAVEKSDEMITLTTRGDCFGVVVKDDKD